MPASKPPNTGDGLAAARPHDGASQVLLVENHVDTRRSVRAFLESLGYQVAEAGNGAEARTQSEQGVFDVMLSDISLPDICGRELLVQLGKLGCGPRHAIAMSGLGGAGEQHRSRQAGFACHLVKPFAPADLQNALEGVASARTPGAREAVPNVPHLPEPERNARLAQRMHDDLCQQLAAAAMWQGMLIQKLENMAPPSRLPGQTIKEARQVSQLLDAAMTETRALMQELRGGDAQS